MSGDGLDAALIGTLYRAACLAELDALKPGNVHAFAAGHRMVVADFITSADVSAPALAQAGAGIDRKSTRLNSSHSGESRMPSSA